MSECHIKVAADLDGSSDTLSKCWGGSVITSWSSGSKLGVMMGHGIENIKLYEMGATAHLSKLGGGSWSITGGRWCGNEEAKVLGNGL